MANAQTNTNKPATKPTPAKPEAAKPDLDGLFETYEKLNASVEKARKEVEESIASRSDVVRSIIEHYGAGPYEFDGMIMQGVIRTSSVEEGSTEEPTSTAFFKVMGKNQKLTKVGKK